MSARVERKSDAVIRQRLGYGTGDGHSPEGLPGEDLLGRGNDYQGSPFAVLALRVEDVRLDDSTSGRFGHRVVPMSRKFFLFVPTCRRLVCCPEDFQFFVAERVARGFALGNALAALGFER